MKTEQIQQIVDGAPDETATHWDESGVYYRYDSPCEYDVWMENDYWRLMPDQRIESPCNIHNLSDLREILALRRERDELAAHVERINKVIDERGKLYTIGDDEDAEDIWQISSEYLDPVLDSAPTQSLEALKLEQQAKALEDLLDSETGYLQTDEGQFAYYDYEISGRIDQLRNQAKEQE